MNNNQKETKTNPKKGKILPAEKGIREEVLNIFKKALADNIFDALLIPAKVPNTDAYSWILLQDESLFDIADPLPPVMTVQGGRALSSFSKKGELDLEIAALMRTCEIRAAVELFKLHQIDLNLITLISIDCPGAMPLTDYMNDPQKMGESYKKISEKWEISESLRPACQNCHRFSLMKGTASDLHIGLLGENNKITLIPNSSKGNDFLEKLGFEAKDSLKDWEAEKEKLLKEKTKKRESFLKEWQNKTKETDGFFNELNKCINCHNCMNACPICYCQQCYFDSRMINFKPETYLQKTKQKGAMRFPLNTMLFHIGRMSHMVLSCVSCGACEDACPVSIPVGRLFSMVGDRTQKEFNYVPGLNREDPLPLQDFKEDEFCEVETPNECEEKVTEEAK
jgi:formate dehydrogenase (coenzyme F420) beta subunit